MRGSFRFFRRRFLLCHALVMALGSVLGMVHGLRSGAMTYARAHAAQLAAGSGFSFAGVFGVLESLGRLPPRSYDAGLALGCAVEGITIWASAVSQLGIEQRMHQCYAAMFLVSGLALTFSFTMAADAGRLCGYVFVFGAGTWQVYIGLEKFTERGDVLGLYGAFDGGVDDPQAIDLVVPHACITIVGTVVLHAAVAAVCGERWPPESEKSYDAPEYSNLVQRRVGLLRRVSSRPGDGHSAVDEA